MKRRNDYSCRKFPTTKWNLILLIFVFCIFLISLVFSYEIVEKNAESMKKEIISSYANADGHNWAIYQEMMGIGSKYVEEMTVHGADAAAIEVWMKDYFQKAGEVIGNSDMRPFALVNGKIIGKDIAEYGKDYDIYQMEWYQRVNTTTGASIITDVYYDVVYEEPVITIAQKCGDSGSILAFELPPGQFRIYKEGKELPQGSAYYICDAKGTLIYKNGGTGAGEEKQEEKFHMLYQQIKQCQKTDEDSHSYMEKKMAMEIYHKQTGNGWMFILLIPQDYLNQNWDILILLYLLVLVVSMGYIIYMLIKESSKSKEIKKMNETVHILGNSYYAFYKINLGQGTYEMLKGSDYVKTRLNPTGKYEELLKVFQEIIIDEEYPQFCKSFSIENLYKLIAQHAKGYGGDFRRLFDGEYVWVNVQLLYVSSINCDEVVLCFRKIGEERKWQLERMELLEDALRAANLSENSQKQFFSNISHDMRTPLNVIIGMSELAEAYAEEPEKVRDYLQKINFSSKQLLGLINGILEVARMEQGMILDKKPFHLQNMMEDCVNVFQSKAKKERKKLNFVCRIQHAMVYGDMLRLEQVINNLISNAMKFTKAGGSISISVSEIDSQTNGKYQIVVADTGIGMSEEFLKNIFVPYEREERFGVQGTGLGMPIVKSIVSLMGGEITVKSVQNQGSTFTITLPLEIAESIEEAEKEGLGETEEKPVRELEGKNILLVEDYDLNMELTTDILKMNGASVLQAWNGLEALDVFGGSQEFSIDAILMDMQMPKMDGCEATRQIRAMKRADAQTIPIIALTANAFAEDIAQTSEAGMNAHISKPLDVKVLCSTLEKYMNA